MFQYIRSIFASTFDHPAVASMFVVAILFAIAGAVFQYGTIPAFGWPRDMIAGFVGIYAVFFVMIGIVGYAVMFLMKYIARAWDRFDPVA
ncbi:hypothetical protein [Natronoglomus mannanivorans]|uniref:Uncharacterized protein n=1 Tax=Natronoglomus mannanivorans TaxID=2979990 RepID=A0AAP2Z4R0_9EURY|nr:hypothetical protein [Halobacteria archaeon AArc-xg1-1]